MNPGRVSKIFLFAVVLFSLVSCANHTDPAKGYSKFFVVRHAERYPGFNGHLTWYGRERAGDLSRLLKDSGIQKIYVTPYSRTLETADSLLLLQKTDTAVFLLDSSGTELARQLKAGKDYGKKVLIIGHGNSLPGILRVLGGTGAATYQPDTVSDLIFEIINDHGRVFMKTMHYGKPSMPDTLQVMGE